jgi:hypothetical protein
MVVAQETRFIETPTVIRPSLAEVDRRLTRRLRVTYGMELLLMGEGCFLVDPRATLLDVSRQGAFITAEGGVERGRRVLLRFSTRGAPIAAADGEIVRVRPGRGFALRFVETDDGYARLIETATTRYPGVLRGSLPPWGEWDDLQTVAVSAVVL